MEERSFMIQAPRLSLQSVSDDDLEAVVELLCNDEIKQTYMVPDFPAREDAVRMFERFKQLSHSAERFVYGIKLDGKLIGLLNEVDVNDGTIEVGYVIHPAQKNNGYATEALQAAIQELFRIGYGTVRAGIFEENAASRRVIEKCGMERIAPEEEIAYRGKTHRCIYFEKRNSAAEH